MQDHCWRIFAALQLALDKLSDNSHTFEYGLAVLLENLIDTTCRLHYDNASSDEQMRRTCQSRTKLWFGHVKG